MDARTAAAIAAFGLASAVGVGAVTMTAVSGNNSPSDSVPAASQVAPEIVYVDAPATTSTVPADGPVVIEYVDVAAPAPTTAPAQRYDDDHDDDHEEHEHGEYEEHDD